MFRFQSKLSLPKCELQTTLQWFHSFLLDFWVNPTRMGIRGSAKQRAAPLCTFSEADQSGLEKGRELLTEGGSRNEGGGKLPLLECKLILDFFYSSKKRFLDEVIGVTNGYGCGNRRKSGTVGYLLNQSSDEPSTTTTGGGAKLLRQLRFLVASFWRLASQVGGLVSKLPSASVKSLSIIGRNGGEGGPPPGTKGTNCAGHPHSFGFPKRVE